MCMGSQPGDTLVLAISAHACLVQEQPGPVYGRPSACTRARTAEAFSDFEEHEFQEGLDVLMDGSRFADRNLI